MSDLTLVMGNRGVRISTSLLPYKQATREFCQQITNIEERWDPYKRQRIREEKEMYAVDHTPSDCIYIHQGHLSAYLKFMKQQGYDVDNIKSLYDEPRPGAKGYLRMIPTLELREEQIPVVDHICTDRPVRVIPAQTGAGKTLCTLYSLAKLNKRAVVTLLPREIGTWVDEMSWMFENGKYEVRVIQGMKSFRKMVHAAQRGKLKDSVILMSSMTLQSYIKEFIQTGETSVGVQPWDLYDILGVDIRVTDEAHERLHFNFLHDMLTNVRRTVYLSATITSNQPFKNRLYETIFPLEDRVPGLTWKKYIDVVGIGYDLESRNDLRYKSRRGSYSHDVFENYILDRKGRTKRYFELISRVVDVGFHQRYQDGMKMLIFCYKQKMCDVLAEYLRQRFPQYTCSAFNQQHEDEVLHNNDIVVTTLKSAGTGKDVKRLTTVLMTVATDSREGNIQVLGRLRPIDKWYPGETPMFYYFVCKDVPQHIRYHNRKLEIFNGLVLSHKTASTAMRV